MAYIAPQPAADARLLGKIEAVEIGTEAVGISAASDTLNIDGSAKIAAVNATDIPLQPVKSGFSKDFDIVGKATVTLTFDMFLEGTGLTGGAEPNWARCLEACGHSVTAADDGTSSSWIFAPISNPRSMSFHWHESNVRRKILGAFGTCSFSFPAGDAPRMSFSFTGQFVAEETGVALPSDAYPASYAVQVENEAFVIGTGSIDYTPLCQTLGFDLAAVQDDRDDINSAFGNYGRAHQDRNPIVNASIEQEVDLSNYNPEADYRARTARQLDWTHGTDAQGAKTEFSMPTCQTKQPTKGTVGAGAGRGQFQIPYKVAVQGGLPNSEYTITHYQAI